MPKCRVELLAAAWRDVDKIAGFHLEKVGVDSAQRITDKILEPVFTTSNAVWPGLFPPCCVEFSCNTQSIPAKIRLA